MPAPIQSAAVCFLTLTLARVAFAQGSESLEVARRSASSTPQPLTWENLESRLEKAADDGLEASILIMRDAKPFLERSFGFANREKNVKLDSNTVFAIGSCPIDFTHAGILLLKDRGQLDLKAPITQFLDDVPEDKSGITIRHLMTGRSGLRDFHDLPTDENADHTWIDRDEAVRRILAQELLFVPGTGQQHSHSAWGLLAAIIEVVSGESYPDFTREHLFKPAGMKDTGFFGDPIPEDRAAVGYGFQQSSEPNSPPHWGQTSWLVMGSGGQVATLRDIARWEIAMRKGKILSPASTEQYLANADGVASDGDMFGFEFMHSKNPESMFLMISNAIDSREKRQKFDELGRSLYYLVSRPQGKFSLGVALAISSEGGAQVHAVTPGGAADQGGLKVGDRLVSVNGVAVNDDPMPHLDPLINSGQTIELEVSREGATLQLSIEPQPKEQ